MFSHKGAEMRVLATVTSLALAAFVLGCDLAAAGDADVSGTWQCTANCRCQPEARGMRTFFNPAGIALKTTTIAQNGTHLILINECIDKTNADLGGNTIKIGQPIVGPQWNTHKATISANQKQITFDNGTVWSR